MGKRDDSVINVLFISVTVPKSESTEPPSSVQYNFYSGS